MAMHCKLICSSSLESGQVSPPVTISTQHLQSNEGETSPPSSDVLRHLARDSQLEDIDSSVSTSIPSPVSYLSGCQPIEHSHTPNEANSFSLSSLLSEKYPDSFRTNLFNSNHYFPPNSIDCSDELSLDINSLVASHPSNVLPGEFNLEPFVEFNF